MAVADDTEGAGRTALRDGARYRRVAGLGSARSGLREWRVQRLTALALIPLGLYFVASVLHLITAGGDLAARWLSRPLNAGLMLLFVAAVFLHAWVGLRSILVDYVHGRAGVLIGNIALRGLALVLSVAGILAILKTLFAGGAPA